MQPLISIIIPVYNVEKYLDECIQSCINQTYKNIEIILIDDGSSDKSAEICKEYAELDSRIIFKSIPNSGVAHARNVGIGISNGSYITFVDSDDFIDEKYCEVMYNLLVDSDADIACCTSYYLQNTDGTYKTVQLPPDYTNEAIYTFDEYKHSKRGLFGGAMSLYKRKCLKILFPLLKQGEDTAHGVLVSYYIKPYIVFCDAALYYYRYNIGSITKSKGFSLEKFIDSFKAFFARLVLFEEYKVYLNKESVHVLYDAYLKFLKYREFELAKCIKLFLKKHYNEFNESDLDYKSKWKVKLICKYNYLLFFRTRRDKLNYFIEMNYPNLYKIIHK